MTVKKTIEFKPSNNLHRKNHSNLLPPADFGARLFKQSNPDIEIDSSNTSRRRELTD